MIFAKNVIMITNIAIDKAFIRHDLVNKLFITKMFYFQCINIRKRV